MVRKVVIIDESKIDFNVVIIGLIVKVKDLEFDEEVEYIIVGLIEVDLYDGKILNEFFVGKVFLGRVVKEVVEV